MERTVKCPICGDPYKVYDYSKVDQSACPDCVAKAERKMCKTIPRIKLCRGVSCVSVPPGEIWFYKGNNCLAKITGLYDA